MPDSTNYRIYLDASQAQAEINSLMAKFRELASSWEQVGRQRGFIGLVGLERQLSGIFSEAMEAQHALRGLQAAAAGIRIQGPGELLSSAEINRVAAGLRNIQTQGERAAHGITTAFRNSFATITQLSAAERGLQRGALPPPTPPTPPGLTAQRESELSIQSAIAQNDILAAASAEKVADAKKIQEQASMRAAIATRNEAEAQRQALATEHEMNQAANEAAETEQREAALRQTLREQTDALKNAEQGYANSLRYSQEQQRATIEIERLRQSQRQAGGILSQFFGSSQDRSAATESEKSIREAAAAYDKLGETAERAGGHMRSFGHATREAGSESSTVIYVIRKLITEFDELIRGQRSQLVSTLGSEIRDLGTQAARAGGGGGIGGMVAGIAKLGPAIAASGLGLLVIHIRSMVGEVQKLAQEEYNAAEAAGMSLQAYQQFAGVMEIVGGKADYAARSMAQVEELLQRARQDPMSRESSAVGQIFGDQRQAFLNTSDARKQIEMLRQAFQSMEDPIRRNLLFVELLGRSGFRALVPYLAMTNAEMERYNKVAAENEVETTETNERIRKQGIEVQILGERYKGLEKQLAETFGSTAITKGLENIVDGLKRMVSYAEAAARALREIARTPQGMGWLESMLTMPSRVAEAFKTPFEREAAQKKAAEDSLKTGSAGGMKADRDNQQMDKPGVFDAAATEKLLSTQTREIENSIRIRKAEDEVNRARAAGNAQAIAQIDASEETFLQDRLHREQQYVQAAINAAKAAHDPDAEKVYQEKSAEIQEQLLQSQAHAIDRQRQLKEQEFQEFSARERDKIAEANGDWGKISAIYQEWANKAIELFGKVGKQWEEVHRDMVKSANEAMHKAIEEQIQYADQQASLLEKQAHIQEIATEAANIGPRGDESHQKKISALTAEISALQSTAGQEIAIYEQIASMQGATVEEIIQAKEKEMDVSVSLAEKQEELAKQVADEQKKQWEDSHKAFEDFAKSVGGDMDKYITDVLERKPGAINNFIQSLRESTLKLGESLLAQTLGKAMGVDVKPGGGLGELFTGVIGKMLGIQQPKDPSTQVKEATQQVNASVKKSNDLLAQIHSLILEQTKIAQAAQHDAQKTANTLAGQAAGTNTTPVTTTDGAGEQPAIGGQYASTIQQAAAKYNVPPQLLYDLIGAESGFKSNAKSSAGAQGLGQFMPATANQFGVNVDDPESSIMGAARYLNYLKQKSGSWQGALGGYLGDPSLKEYSGEKNVYGPALVREAQTLDKTQDVNIVGVGGAGITSPQEPGTLPTSAGSTAPGGNSVNVVSSVPIDIKSLPSGTQAPVSGVPTPSGYGGIIPFPTSMPSDIKSRLMSSGSGLPGRRAYGPGVSDGMGGMLSIVHPGEMVVPTDVLAHLPSSQGGQYDIMGSESRGFQSVATVPVAPKQLTWPLMVMGGILGMGLLGGLGNMLKGNDDQQALSKKLLDAASTDDGSISNVSQTTTPLSSGALANIPDLSPLASTKAPSSSSDSSSDSSKSLLGGLSSLTTNLDSAAKSVGSFSTATGTSTTGVTALTGVFSTLKAGVGAVQSVFSMLSGSGGGGGGAGGGAGGIMDTVGSIFSTVMKFIPFLEGGGIIPSAAGGMIVPRFQGGGVLSMLHMNEMVLPAHISQFVQNAATNGNSSSGSSHTVHFNINAIDSRSGAQFLMNNADHIARAYARSHQSYSRAVPR